MKTHSLEQIRYEMRDKKGHQFDGYWFPEADQHRGLARQRRATVLDKWFRTPAAERGPFPGAES